MKKKRTYKTRPGPKLKRPNCQKDWDDFDKLCYLQCTLIEIAGFFECSEDTIENRVKSEKKMKFSDYYKIKSSKGKTSLRRHQFKCAEKGNSAMLIWLGKQYLGQAEKQAFVNDDGKSFSVQLNYKLEDDDDSSEDKT